MMRIKEIITQARRDFKAVYECEHCGFTYRATGYDDTNFHENVIPEMLCKKCGKTADKSYRPLKTKYPDRMTI